MPGWTSVCATCSTVRFPPVRRRGCFCRKTKDVVWITNGFPVRVNFDGRCRDIVVWNLTAPCSGNYVDFNLVLRLSAGQLDTVGVSMYPVDEWTVGEGDRILVNEM